MNNKSDYLILAIIAVLFWFTTFGNGSNERSETPRADTSAQIRVIDTSKTVYRDRIVFKTKMKLVRGNDDTTHLTAFVPSVDSVDSTGEPLRRFSATGFRPSDRYEFDTVAGRDTLKFEFFPLSHTLLFDRKAFSDTCRFRFVDTNKTITVYVPQKKPWYEPYGYIAGGLVCGAIVGFLFGVK